MTIIGIDPGDSGGIAFLDPGQVVPLVVKMPQTPHDFCDLMREYDPERTKVWIEKVGPMPKQGVSSLWTFAETFWGPQWALSAMKFPFESVRPQVWQKALQCMTGGDKNVSKAMAQQLWPSEKWTHATSDAALICEYGRRTEAARNVEVTVAYQE